VGLESLGQDYYRDMVEKYRERRTILLDGLRSAGFRCQPPEGAYYILADFSDLSPLDDVEFSLRLTREAGVTPVPASSFFHEAALGRNLVRFVFCKEKATLEAAAERLRAFANAGS
jgi:aminotransferase